MTVREGEYESRGDYHKHLDPNWSYYPIYTRKVAFVDEFLEKLSDRNAKILDVGCGEGVLVEKYKNAGFDIKGIDLNYSSELVVKGDILSMPFPDASFDVLFCLDVIEHLEITSQRRALEEIKRIMSPTGFLLISIPNLAHGASRWKFFRHGELIRTANVYKHPGDRPIKEYLRVIGNCGFQVRRRFPIQLTQAPFLKKLCLFFLGVERYERFIYSPRRNPDDCFLNIFVLTK